jgi:small subunit ribosomal protein S7
MARRRRADKRQPHADTRYNSVVLSKFINQVMRRGKKSTAENIVYGALDELKEKTGEDPLHVFEKALGNMKPRVEVKSRRVGGATYQVPVEVSSSRQESLAMRWLVQASLGKKGVRMRQALATELLDAYNNQGSVIKKREDTHRMAQANRAFAHYRW